MTETTNENQSEEIGKARERFLEANRNYAETMIACAEVRRANYQMGFEEMQALDDEDKVRTALDEALEAYYGVIMAPANELYEAYQYNNPRDEREAEDEDEDEEEKKPRRRKARRSRR